MVRKTNMAVPCYIFEGTWWRHREVPQILPYFQALQVSGNRIALSHRTFRSADDIAYWLRKIPKGTRAIVYFASHGESQCLMPTGERSRICPEDLHQSLAAGRERVGFLHFSCCEMIDSMNRKRSLQAYLDASGASWVSGYDGSVDWLPSTLLDLALIVELLLPYYRDARTFAPRMTRRVTQFMTQYEQLTRHLRFSGLYSDTNNNLSLFPARHRNKQGHHTA